MIRAVGANRAKERASFVREGIDSLVVNNQLHLQPISTQTKNQNLHSVPGAYSKHTWFSCVVYNDSLAGYSSYVTRAGLGRVGLAESGYSR
jgi:hypothetical protein